MSKRWTYAAVRHGEILSLDFSFKSHDGSMTQLRVLGHSINRGVVLHAKDKHKESLTSLDKRQAGALRDFLNKVLGGSSREARVL